MRGLPVVFQILLSVLVLAGCAYNPDPDGLAVPRAFRYLWSGAEAATQTRLNPNFRYLRVQIRSDVAILALGNLEPASRAGGIPTAVWYSAEGEVLRIQDGRITGTDGLSWDWRRVELPVLPAPGRLAPGQILTYQRSRDLMPGYHFGVVDQVTEQPVLLHPQAILHGIPADRLRWIKISSVPVTSNQEQLPEAYVGVWDGPPQGSWVSGDPVYGEQCLGPDYCLIWQVWPVS